MTVTWLGQAGLLFESGKTTILIDPYFSDSAASLSGHRRLPVDNRVWEIKPDIILLTHDHIDHYDPETLPAFVNKNTAVTVLSPHSVWEKIRPIGGKNNFVRVIPGVVWTQGDLEITTVSAVHSDPFAVGFLIAHSSKSYYVTGDTLFCPPVLDKLPKKTVDAVFLPINGVGNNLNSADAEKFAEYVNASVAVPIHYGMLDDLTHDIFRYKNKFPLEPYKKTEI